MTMPNERRLATFAPTRPAEDANGQDNLPAFAARAASLLVDHDPMLYGLLHQELARQHETLMMVAAATVAHPSVLACKGTWLTNVTAEGYPGARFHAGCEVVDEIERLAIERAKTAFGARYANVQPHSATSANLCVMMALLSPGVAVLGLDLASGGHLSHGAKASVVGQYFDAIGYSLDERGLIDFDEVEELAWRHRPRLIICGASSYPRVIDFARFREIADTVGAYLLADISHIAGLVAAGEHPSPIDHAHITTTSTYKQLNGPRGGLILMGKDADCPAPSGTGTLAQLMQRAVFPVGQGTPDLAAVAAKATALQLVATDAFRDLARRIVRDARMLADGLASRGYRVLTGGTDNHMVLVDIFASGLTGLVAERALEACGIVVNRNRIPRDAKPARVTSGLRLGTNALAIRGMAEREMPTCADLVHTALSGTVAVTDDSFMLEDRVREDVRAAVRDLCQRFPIPGYSATAEDRAGQADKGAQRAPQDDGRRKSVTSDRPLA
jgi:glycine hydroxymethyltransferase